MKSVLHAATYVAERFAAIITWLACAMLVIAALHIFADMVMTKLFRSPINGTSDIVTNYYMVALFFLPLAYCESRSSHIDADLIMNFFPVWLQRSIRIGTYILLTSFLALWTWQSTVKAIKQTAIGDMRLLGDLYLLLWPPRWVVVLGLAAFTVVALLKTIAMIAGADRSDEQTSAEVAS
ncbi:TRAP transporter small permease [Corticibacterium sp. UT-5YL-CI-8]|nr:TRAP transporter small permease [Tianweitania sp. UT-5YL-CI-8]